MAVTGGDIIEITYNHPTIGSGVIYPKANEDNNLDLGGFRGNDDANSIDGGGRNIRSLSRSRWSCEITPSWDTTVTQDLEKMVALAGDANEAVWTIQLINGSIYSGTGSPVGDLQGNYNNATFKLKIAGGGLLKKIA